jgi:thioredoxin 1
MRGPIAVGLVAVAASTAYSGWLPQWLWPSEPANHSPTENPLNLRGEHMSISTSNPMAGRVHHVGEDQFDREVLQSTGTVLVDFYADWCGPCKALAPVLEELARETPQAKIVKVNVDHAPGLASRYRVNSIPTLVVFRDGQAKSGLVGLASKSHLRTLLTE